MDGELIDGKIFLLQNQDQQSSDSDEDATVETIVSDFTASRQDIHCLNSLEENNLLSSVLTPHAHYPHSRETTRAEFERFDGKRQRAYKTWRRDKQGFSKNEFKYIYRNEMNGSAALRWDKDHLSYILRVNYQWAEKLRGILTEDCFPEYYITS